MKQLGLFAIVVYVALAQETVIDPRGARPVQPGIREEKCATQKEWPFCSDDDWGPKCPSGCRIQGLMNQYDHDLLKKIEKIRSLLEKNRAQHRSTDQVSKQTYDYLKEKLTIDAGNDNRYHELALSLRQRITDLKVRIDRHMQILDGQKKQVRDQVDQMQKLEVDIDIKLRSCKGSCAGYHVYQVDQDSYVSLKKQVDQLDSQTIQNIESVGSMYVIRTRSLEEALQDRVYRSKSAPGQPKVDGQQKQDVFADVKTFQLVLEAEGSSSSPATISKEPGTPLPLPGPSSDSDPFKSITELGGRGDGGFFDSFNNLPQPVKTTSCTKSIKTTVVQSKDGPVERLEEVVEGGADCDGVPLTKGGLGSLFPTLSFTSTSTKTGLAGGAKGAPEGDPFGLDLGAFMTDNAEDDIPDFQARSVKAERVERQADYVGKGTATTDME